MLNKRLIGMVSESKRYIAGNVLCQWISLVANLVMMVWVTNLLASLFAGTVDRNTLLATLGGCRWSGGGAMSLHHLFQ